MSKAKTYLFHEVSSYLPLLEGEDFDALVEDIKQFGQIEPAILFEGRIIDGRNRYRACKKLSITLKTREWKPSGATGITPLQFVISENIMRRHLTIAQRSEVGLLLLEEEEKLAKERKVKIGEEMGKVIGKGQKIEKGQAETLTKKIDEIKEVMGEGRARDKVAPKVKVGSATLAKAKKIKEIAKEDKKIAEDWEKAKKGYIGVDAVYKKVQEKEFIKDLEVKEPEVKKAIEEKRITYKEAKEVIALPKELKNAVIKPESKITVKEAKEVAKLPEDMIRGVAREDISVDDAKTVAEIQKPELREEAVKVLKKQKEQQKLTKDYMVDVGTGKKKPEIKTIDLDMKIINQFTQIYKQVIMKMTVRLADSYPEQTKVRLLKIMKEILIHLQKELKIKGDIITAKKN
ncbi:MAG: ParB N-terminal domain-containing protein [Patescibacteria group bacterium]|nr:ParB N-terminal domain-containing protein [Patescibacteria group bacterium]